MQTNNIDISELADMLADPTTKILDTVDSGSSRMYVLEWTGQDIIVISDSSGGATCIYPCHMFDAESAGSIHDHARAIAKNA